MIPAPHMILIGAAGRNAGKTAFACELIRRFRGNPVSAAKVTAVEERDGRCPRGGAGCGVCSSLAGAYCLTEETEAGTLKDTQRLLACGARRVLWLRVLKAELEAGARALLERLEPDVPVICESNSLRRVVVPGVFVMVRHRDEETVKASARGVQHYADAVVLSDGERFDFDMNRIHLKNGRWFLDGLEVGMSTASRKTEKGDIPDDTV